MGVKRKQEAKTNAGRGAAPIAKQRRLNAGRGAAKIQAEKTKTLLLQIQRSYYNAIMNGSKTWEARPLFEREDKGEGKTTMANKLAKVGLKVKLQSGSDTNDSFRITEVCKYENVEEMVNKLGADLLPDVVDTRAGVEVYNNLGYDAAQLAGER